MDNSIATNNTTVIQPLLDAKESITHAAATYETKVHATNTYSTITDLYLLNQNIQAELDTKVGVDYTYSKSVIDQKDTDTLQSAQAYTDT